MGEGSWVSLVLHIFGLVVFKSSLKALITYAMSYLALLSCSWSPSGLMQNFVVQRLGSPQ